MSAPLRKSVRRARASGAASVTTAQSVHLNLGERSYDILVERGILPRLGSETAARVERPDGRLAVIITQPKVDLYFGDAARESLLATGFRVKTISIAAGEVYKTLQTVRRIYNALLADAVDGRTVIVALGGGVIGDVAGFVAATYQRGLPFVQVPTTLLAQVDSSVGGKTGVNLGHAKNLIGAFYQPRLVLCDPDTLLTLPLRERRSGMAEIIKYGLIADAAFFDDLMGQGDNLLRLRSDRLEYAIAQSCRLKARVVEKDERDTGLRAILNFGHTVGHALEALTRFRVFRHGEAIALGMVAAAYIGEELEITDPEDTAQMLRIFRQNGFNTQLGDNLDLDAIVSLLAWDKKSVDGAARFVLMERIGKATPGHAVSPETVRRALARMQSNFHDA